jgi:hypothetical protein
MIKDLSRCPVSSAAKSSRFFGGDDAVNLRDALVDAVESQTPIVGDL